MIGEKANQVEGRIRYRAYKLRRKYHWQNIDGG